MWIFRWLYEWWTTPSWIMDSNDAKDHQVWYSLPPGKGKLESWTLDSTYDTSQEARHRVAEMRQTMPDPGHTRIQIRRRHDGGCQEW